MFQLFVRSACAILPICAAFAGAVLHASAEDAKRAVPQHPAAHVAIIKATGPDMDVCPAGYHANWFTDFCYRN